MHSVARLSVSSVLALVANLGSTGARADDTVVVTATRTEQPLSEVGQTVSVIEAAAIERRQSNTVVDFLRNVPGVTITRNGGIGSTTSVFIRGAESDQTVALIDGVKLNDPSSPGGGFNFGNLLVGNIARIEVLRGSQSVLWGSQAIGGVVNLTTIDPTEELAANAQAEYGWRNTRELVGNVSQKLGPGLREPGRGQFPHRWHLRFQRAARRYRARSVSQLRRAREIQRGGVGQRIGGPARLVFERQGGHRRLPRTHLRVCATRGSMGARASSWATPRST